MVPDREEGGETEDQEERTSRSTGDGSDWKMTGFCFLVCAGGAVRGWEDGDYLFRERRVPSAG